MSANHWSGISRGSMKGLRGRELGLGLGADKGMYRSIWQWKGSGG